VRLPNSLHARIGLFSLALFLVVQIPTLVIAYRGNNEVANERLSADLDHGTRTFRRVLDERGVQLALATRVLAGDFAFRKALAVAEPAAIQSVLENHSARLRADFGLVLSPTRSVVASTGTAATGSALLLASVAPEAEESAGRTIILALDRRLVQIAVVPVLAPDLVGWAAFGWDLDQRAANDLKQLVDVEITFLSVSETGGIQVSASTLPSSLHEEIRRQISGTGALKTEVRTVELGGENYASNAIALDERRPARAMVLTHQSVNKARAPFRKFTDLLATLSIVGIAACVLGSSILAGAIARPIRSLTAMTESMRVGELGSHVSGKLTGELQGLANSFNRLIDSLRQRDAEVLQLAYFDSLTGLSNRVGFVKAAPHRLNAAGTDAFAAVALLDVASSSQINSVLGHEVGDEVIRAVAASLRDALPESDLIARFGSDNFAVLLIKGSEQELESTLRHLITQFDLPLLVVKQAIDVRMNVGWAQLREDGIDLATVMRRADMALNVARVKQLPILRFNHAMEATTHTHFALLSDLKLAIVQNELELYYQPKLSMRGVAVGLEALVRWNHPQRGLIMPDAFIGIAEQTGAVREVTRYVVAEAVHQVHLWSDDGLKLPIAVNISARDLQDDSFPRFVAAKLTESGVDASLLRFEITERALLDNLDAAARTLRALQHIGIRVSLDDYGTGYATLTHISQLPVSELKIDRSFVTRLTADTRNYAIVLSTVEMGHRLGMNIVAEGVETIAELDAVRQSGCDEVQGYYFSKPLAARDVPPWMRDHQAT
jgi:diguanylate cyclase (GGDEF)-like protein